MMKVYTYSKPAKGWQTFLKNLRRRRLLFVVAKEIYTPSCQNRPLVVRRSTYPVLTKKLLARKSSTPLENPESGLNPHYGSRRPKRAPMIKRPRSKRISRRVRKSRPFKLEGTVELIGDLDRGLEELKREREISLLRSAEKLKQLT
jgi:hypothetical protein